MACTAPRTGSVACVGSIPMQSDASARLREGHHATRRGTRQGADDDRGEVNRRNPRAGATDASDRFTGSRRCGQDASTLPMPWIPKAFVSVAGWPYDHGARTGLVATLVGRHQVAPIAAYTEAVANRVGSKTSLQDGLRRRFIKRVAALVPGVSIAGLCCGTRRPQAQPADTVRGFDHVAVPMQNSDAMVRFYRHLGFTVRSGTRICSVHFGDHKIHFHRPTLWQSEAFTLRASAAKPPCGDFCFVWGGSPDTLRARLDRAGVEIVEGPVERQGGRTVAARPGRAGMYAIRTLTYWNSSSTQTRRNHDTLHVALRSSGNRSHRVLSARRRGVDCGSRRPGQRPGITC